MPKDDPAEAITTIEYLTAERAWVNFWTKKRIKPPIRFCQFLGMIGPPLLLSLWKSKSPIMIRGSAARKVRMLTGPHSHALLTAYAIRKGVTE